MESKATATPNGDGTPKPRKLFLSIDLGHQGNSKGGYVFTFASDIADEAREVVTNLLSYLIHAHGESATLWFTPSACDRADTMIWDEAEGRPVSTEEVDMDDMLDEDFEWAADLEDFQSKISIEGPIRPARKIKNNPFIGETDSVSSKFHPSTDLSDDGEDAADHGRTGGGPAIAGDFDESSATVVA